MKYIVPVIAVVALVLGIFSAVPNKMLGGQYSTNHAYFAGITNTGSLTQTGTLAVTGDSTVSDDLAVSGSFCFVQSGVYYTLVASSTALTVSLTSSTASCL